jgi:hypothetical protein
LTLKTIISYTISKLKIFLFFLFFLFFLPFFYSNKECAKATPIKDNILKKLINFSTLYHSFAIEIFGFFGFAKASKILKFYIFFVKTKKEF